MITTQSIRLDHKHEKINGYPSQQNYLSSKLKDEKYNDVEEIHELENKKESNKWIGPEHFQLWHRTIYWFYRAGEAEAPR